MRRINIIIIASTALILGACAGEGDDTDTASATTTATTADPGVETASEGAATSNTDDAQPSGDEPGTAEETGTVTSGSESDTDDSEPDTDDGDDTDVDDTDDSDMIVVDNMSDMPSECVDVFRRFLVEIEPIVEPIDWERATFAELDDLGTEFDQLGTEFQSEIEQLGCDRFDITSGEAGIDEMIEFARTEAPGTIGFFEFIDGIQNFADQGDDDVDAADAPETCDDAIGAIEALMDDYGQMTNVPAGELMTITSVLSSLPDVCSVAEIESVLERDDIQAFLDG